jgi:hypothetical protein
VSLRSVPLNAFGSHAAHHRRDGSCEPADPADTVTDRLNNLLAHGGDGYTLSLCPSAHYLITAPVLFAAPNQEISTLGYPTDDTRATLVVNGVVQDGSGHTTAVDGTCATCGGVKLRNIQVNGTRGGAPPTNGGGNIEMGGSNSNQLVEYVHSYDPRGWSCLHAAEQASSSSTGELELTVFSQGRVLLQQYHHPEQRHRPCGLERVPAVGGRHLGILPECHCAQQPREQPDGRRHCRIWIARVPGTILFLRRTSRH